MDRTLAESLLAGLPLPALVIGMNERIELANPAAEALFGPVSGRPSATVLRHPGFIAGLDAALHQGQGSVRRVMLPAPGGGEQHLDVRFAAVADGDGWRGTLVSFIDLTALEQAEAMRRDFVANVSHELRTPLTALMGFIETLKTRARDDPAARERFLGIMEREAGRMIRLVSDLLSLSRVEAEERVRPSETVELTGLLGSVITTLRPQAQAAGVTLELAGESSPVEVQGDADQLQQVFQNLAENALRYAASGKEVTLQITRVPREPVLRGPAVSVAVIDRGEGIDPVHVPRLTERFYRVDAHRSREKGGTGLGLAIVKHIVNRHRGRLRIESTPGKGSKFIVLLPVQP